MANLVYALYDLRQMDDLARGRSAIHRAHPLAKLTATALYLVALASFAKYETVRLLPFVLFPVVLAAVGGIPARPIIKRLLYAEPLIIGIGLLNPLFDRGLLPFAGWQVAGGWLVFASIVFKATLGMSAALMLMATTGIDGIASALRSLKVPRIFVMQLMLTYRYLSVLMEEVVRIVNAHSLRSCSSRSLGRHVWSPLLGQLLLRTVDRAQRVYDAMLLRGFNGEYYASRRLHLRWSDAVFAAGWTSLFLLFRLTDVPMSIGSIILGGRP